MKTPEDVRAKENEILTTIAERLSEKLPQSEVYEMIDDIVKVSIIVRLCMKENYKPDIAYKLLDEIGK